MAKSKSSADTVKLVIWDAYSRTLRTKPGDEGGPDTGPLDDEALLQQLRTVAEEVGTFNLKHWRETNETWKTTGLGLGSTRFGPRRLGDPSILSVTTYYQEIAISVAVGSAFIGLAGKILLQYIKNAGNRKVTIKRGKDSITLTGSTSLEKAEQTFTRIFGPSRAGTYVERVDGSVSDAQPKIAADGEPEVPRLVQVPAAKKSSKARVTAKKAPTKKAAAKKAPAKKAPAKKATPRKTKPPPS